MNYVHTLHPDRTTIKPNPSQLWTQLVTDGRGAVFVVRTSLGVGGEVGSGCRYVDMYDRRTVWCRHAYGVTIQRSSMRSSASRLGFTLQAADIGQVVMNMTLEQPGVNSSNLT